MGTRKIENDFLHWTRGSYPLEFKSQKVLVYVVSCVLILLLFMLVFKLKMIFKHYSKRHHWLFISFLNTTRNASWKKRMSLWWTKWLRWNSLDYGKRNGSNNSGGSGSLCRFRYRLICIHEKILANFMRISPTEGGTFIDGWYDDKVCREDG